MKKKKNKKKTSKSDYMKYSYSRAFLWLVTYLLLCLVPLGIAVSGIIPEHRAFWIETGVALGFIGLGMFALQFLFSGRITKIAPSFGMDNILNFHKIMGILAFIFVLVHPAVLVLSNPEFLAYFDPQVNLLRAIALSTVTVAVILITATSLWRTTFKMDYERWRLVHGVLALAIVFIGTVHAIQVGHYLEPLWKKIALGTVMGGSMYLVIHTRLVRPWKSKKKPYKVTEVKEQRGPCWTLKLEPEGHKGMRFISGQFAWITVNNTPFTLQQHPFTIASSPESRFLLFTAKPDGDFTSTWEDMKPGTKAFLEGPFGSFTLPKKENLFLVMGGIGITPAISMLRTLRDRKDSRKAILIYGSITWEEVTFREELEELEKELNLNVIHLLMEPPDDWEGETGVVSEELLDKYLPEHKHEYRYFICGPKPMMDITELALRNLSVDWRHIYTERFEIV